MRSLTLSAVLVASCAVVVAPMTARAQTPVTSVRGNGGWFELLPDGVVLDDIRINAWVNADGKADGTVTWAGVYNGYIGPGPGSSGYTWQMQVTGLAVAGNVAMVDAVVVASPQLPSAVGTQLRFLVIDNGAGATDSAGYAFDTGYTFGPEPIHYGNFTVQSAN